MRTNLHNIARRKQPRGFTFVELMIGILITSLVMGALAAVLSAVAQGWKQSGSTISSVNMTALANLRLQRTLKAACLLGVVRPGSIDNSSANSAAVLLWKSDSNFDWKIQFSEMALLEYRSPSETEDPNTIRLYQVSFPSSWTAAQKTDADSTLGNNDEIYQDSEIGLFKNQLDYVTHTTLLRNVTGCVFHKNDSSATTRPSIDYEMTITSADGTSETNLGSVALRTPSTLPVSQR